METTMSVRKVSDYVWEIPTTAKEGMQVPARIYASEELLKEMDAGVFDQVTNVACLPGIRGHALCMPDGHWGYGFPIGGVAAFSTSDGMISPGGIGFDINCGMRLIRTNLTRAEVQPRLRELVEALFRAVPTGVGCRGFVHLSGPEFREMAAEGAAWCVRRGFGRPEDLEATEDGGRIPGADPEAVSHKAVGRGIHQLGTLGSGNHYLEIQVIEPRNVLDPELAAAFGLDIPEQIVVMFHCGSRGFGHQVATDYLRVFEGAMRQYGIAVRDRELACAPWNSPEGRRYFSAMACAANAAFANRQVICHRVREVFVEIFGRDEGALGLEMIYDVAHNIAKVERYRVGGEERELVIHRKGATRAFAPGRPEIPPRYRALGQPVIIGGSMETGSYLLVGTPGAMEETFGSTAHGSGRTMSRAAARKRVHGKELQRDLEARGIYVRTASYAGLAEEAGFAYKDIARVVEAVEGAGISRPVVRFVPIGNIKG